MKSPNAHIWCLRGVPPKQHAASDKAMALLMEAAEFLASPDLFSRVVSEARWQTEVLPGLTEMAQRDLAWRKP